MHLHANFLRFFCRSRLFVLAATGALTSVGSPALVAAEVLRHFPAKDQTVLTAVAATGSGDLYVAGVTLKPATLIAAFPSTVRIGPGDAPPPATGIGDAFLLRLSSSGQILGAAIWGGSSSDLPAFVRVAPSGDVIVAGTTHSEDFPTGSAPVTFAALPPAGGQRAMFVARFSSIGTNLLTTQFFANTDPSGLAVDNQDHVIIAGLTASPEVFAPDEEGFTLDASAWSGVGKLAADGTGLTYWRWLGHGLDLGRVQGLTVDAAGNAYVTGTTSGNGVPITNALQSVRPALNVASPFLSRIDPNGLLLFSTFLGGERADDSQAVALNSAGEILVAGVTSSGHLPAAMLERPTPEAAGERAFLVGVDGQGQTLVQSNLFVAGLVGPLRGPVILADGRRLLAGRGPDLGSGPVFATFDDAGGRAYFDPLRQTQHAELRDLVAGSNDSFYAVGSETVGGQNSGSFLARYRSSDFPSAKPAEIRLVHPQSDLRYPVGGTIAIQAQLTGVTGAVRSVTFRIGRKVLGTVTNAPYSLSWSNTTRGVHVVSATAEVDGRALISPSVIVTVASPGNDSFARRTRLSGAPVEVTGDLGGATSEAGEPNLYQPSVWYAWSPPADGVYEIRLETDSALLPGLVEAGIYAGPTLGQLAATRVSLLVAGQAMAFSAKRGDNLNIRVGANTSPSFRAEFRLRLRRVTAPANDDLANAATVTGSNIEAMASLANATTEPSEPLTTASVWYRWTAPRSGEFLLSSPAMVNINAYIGSEMSDLIAIGTPVSGVTNGATFLAEEGTTYSLGISGSGQTDVPWRLQPVQPPANDRLFAATVIPPGVESVTGSLLGAHYEDEGIQIRLFAPNVWWTWRPVSTGRYLINVRPLTSLSEVNSDGSVRTIPSRTDLVSVYALDGFGTLHAVTTNQNFYGPDLVDVEAGTEYAIAVSGYLSWFALDLTLVRPPANDHWSDAQELQGTVAGVDGRLEWAGLETGEPVYSSNLPSPRNGLSGTETVRLSNAARANFGAGSPSPRPAFGTTRQSVWYRWIAPTNGDFILMVNGAYGRVFTGSSVSTLTAVSSDLYTPRFTASANTPYYLQISDSSMVGASEFTVRLRPTFSPVNDAFAGSLPLAGQPAPFVPDAIDPSIEPGEPNGPGTRRGSIWYSWTAPSSGAWSLEWGGTVPAVYVGDTISNLVSIPAYASPVGYEFTAVAGTNYHFALDAGAYAGFWVGSVPAVKLQPISPPANNHFSARIPLRGRTVNATGSNIGASRETDEPLIDLNASGRTVWWSWRAPENGYVAISQPTLRSSGSRFGGALGVFAGNSLATLSNLTSASLHLPVQAGQEYQIVVDSLAYLSSGEFGFRIAYHSVLPNDHFEDRRPFDGSVAGTFLGATIEPDEPAAGWALAPSAWWTWTPKKSGFYELNFAAWEARDEPSVRVAAEVFTGEYLSSLEVLARIHLGSPLPPNPTRIFLRAGTPYALRISGNPVDTRFSFRATYLTPPKNDRFDRRLVLQGTNFAVTASVASAWEGLDPDSLEPEVWWTWTAPFSGAVHAQVKPSSLYDCPRVLVFTGPTVDERELVADPALAVTFPVTAGQHYEIAVYDDGCGGPLAPFTLEWTLHRPPVNDAFTNRLAVTGTNVVVGDVTLWGATLEPEDPAAEFGANASLWWKWFVPATGRYTFTGITALYAVDSFGTRTLVATNPPNLAALNVDLASGTELAILLADEVGLAPRRSTWSLRAAPSPANDDFAGRTPIIGPRVGGTLEGATLDPGAPIPFPAENATVWWSLQVTNSGWRRILLQTPDSTRASLAVFEGDTLNSLGRLNPTWEAPDGYAYYYLLPGVDYALAVFSVNGWFGPVELTVRDMVTPANDWFTNAVDVTGTDVTMTADNRLCTLEPGEPPRVLTRGVNSVWWRWTAPQTGVFSITRTNSPMFAFVDVYTGTSLTNLERVADTTYARDFGEYLFRTEAGTTYYISGTTAGFYPGSLSLRLLAANPPANDDFAQRTTLTGYPVSATANNQDATAEPGDPVAGALGGQTLWWRWTAPVAGQVTITKSNAFWATRVGIFTGTTLTNLTPVVAPNDAWPVTFSATGGTEYALGLTTWSAYSQTLDFTLDLLPGAPPGEATLALRAVPGSETRRHSLFLNTPALGRSWVVESSPDLQQWTPVTTNAAGTATFAVPTNMTEPARFYRARIP